MTDSKSLCQSLMRHWEDKKTINNLINTLNVLGTYARVRIRLVKAHTNSEGNNRADLIAKFGALLLEALKNNINVEDINDILATYTYLKSKTE